MSTKIIVSLCDFTGNWIKPYAENGYECYIYDLKYGIDVISAIVPGRNIYGVLAAPPCTDFSLSGAQYWKQKDADGRTEESLRIVDACLDFIKASDPHFWALENPVGRLPKLRPELGQPRLRFNPCDYGGYGDERDAYTKKTYLWGRFNIPEKKPIDPIFVIASNGDRYSPVHMATGGKSEKTKMLRSTTPLGFARAFYEFNK
jgi:hypothetical protein